MLELRGPIGGWFTWDGEVPRPVPRRRHRRRAGRRDDPHARRLGRADLLRVVAVGRTLDELAYADELERVRATLALTRAEPRRPGGRAVPTADEVAPLVAGVELAYVCGSAASRRTPRSCSSRAGSTRRPSASSSSARRATEAARLRPRRSAAGPGAQDVSTRAATRQSIPPDRTPGSTVQPGGLCKTGNSGATSIRGEMVAPLPSSLQRREGRACYGSGTVRGSGARRSPRCCPTTRCRRRWPGTT